MTSLTEAYRAKATTSRLLSDPEQLLCDGAGFGLTNATPLQRAIAWFIGCGYIPDKLWGVEDVQTAFGGQRPSGRSEEFGIVAGIRGGKTLMAAMAVAWATQHVDLETGRGAHMVRGEVPRVSIVSVSKDQAETAFGYLSGAFTGSPALSSLLVCPPTTDTITVRHPSGRPIEICVVAGSKAGASLVGRWCAGVIFDEAPLMALDDEGKIRLKDMATQVRMRMLKGAKIMYIGSPWGNQGYIYDSFHQNFGKENASCVWVKAQGWMLNPVVWTPEEQAWAKANDERGYRLNCLAEFMDPEEAMYSSVAIDQAMKRTELVKPPEDDKTYTAAIDPGTRGNAWTFAIAETEDNLKYDVVYTQQWIGSTGRPLVPGEVFDEMLPVLQAYRCAGSVKSDQWSVDALRELAFIRGIGISPITITPQNKLKLYESVRVRLNSGLLSLPPDPVYRADLLSVKKRLTSEGFKVILPESSDGRHCDFAAVTAILVGDYLESSAERRPAAEEGPGEEKDDEYWAEPPDPWGDEELVDNREYDA